MKKCWEHYSHTADMGIRGFGATMEEAFASAALAMTAVIVNPAKIAKINKIEVICEQKDNELLFVEWLNSLLYEMAARKMLFSKYKVRVKGSQLTGQAWGEKLDIKRHRPVVEIKGISFSDLKVAQKDGQWIAQCIIDI